MANNGWFQLDPNYRSTGKTDFQKRQAAQQQRAQSQQPPPKAEPRQNPPEERNTASGRGKPAAPPQPGAPAGRNAAPSQGRPAPQQQPSSPAGRPPVPSPGRPAPQSELAPWNVTAKHSQTIGPDGPVVLHDTKLHETLETFVNAKIPERAVHVKGWGAFGTFQLTHSMREYTKASLFQNPGTQVPVTTRFSLAVSTKGTPDTGRNVRGFSTKFYTDEGVFDLLCNHLPVFLVRDAIRFPESIEAFLPNPANNLADPNRFWGFVARAPEATHFVTWLYSDEGTIKSLRQIHGYSVNTYVWRNAQNIRTLVKYHWVPLAGEAFIDREEAGRLAGENPDICGQDLFNTIARGTPVEYQLCVQLMNPADAAALPFDPLDDTKTWDEEDYPLLPVGRLTLNRNPQDFMEQVEKVAFSPANLLDGIELSNDKMLEGRSFIYYDAQRHRLGSDFRKLPVNRQAGFTPAQLPDTGIGVYQQGDQMRTDIPKADDFSQAGERYRSLSEVAQANLVSNIAVELPLVSADIQSAVLGYLHQADPEFAARVQQQMQGAK